MSMRILPPPTHVTKLYRMSIHWQYWANSCHKFTTKS